MRQQGDLFGEAYARATDPNTSPRPPMSRGGQHVVDLFSGCGGMSLGFQNAGFQVVAAFDNWKPAVEVYRANFDHPIHELDLGNPKAREVVRVLKPDVIVGGPPCQDFSSAGPNNKSSVRSELIGSFVDVIEAARPRFFVLENVPRLRLKPLFDRQRTRLKNMGYGLTMKVLDASYCGVPQTRKRLFLIGDLNSEDGFLDDHLEKGISNERLSLRSYLGADLDTDYYFRVPTNYSRRGVFSVDEPSVTIRTVDRPIPKGYPGHPMDPVPIGPQVRGLTTKERSYVQTFPKKFDFGKTTKTNQNQMIGNAVPVKLAEFVAAALRSHIAP